MTICIWSLVGFGDCNKKKIYQIKRRVKRDLIFLFFQVGEKISSKDRICGSFYPHEDQLSHMHLP